MTRIPARCACPTSSATGIGPTRACRIADQGHILARVHGLQKLGGGGALIVLVQCNRARRIDGVPREQRAAGSLSSQAIRLAARSASIARGLASPRLPIGVATT